MPHRMTGEERRRLLAEAALRVIERKGERGATVRAITAEADMPLSTFHYIYETRADVIRDVYHLLRTGDEHFVPPTVSPDTPMSEVLARMLERWFRSVKRDHRNDLGEMEIITHSIRTPDLEHLPAIFHEDYEDRVIGGLEAAMHMVGVRAKVPLRDISRMLLVISHGAVYSYLRSHGSVKPGYFATLTAGFDVFFEPDPALAERATTPTPAVSDESVALTSAVPEVLPTAEA